MRRVPAVIAGALASALLLAACGGGEPSPPAASGAPAAATPATAPSRPTPAAPGVGGCRDPGAGPEPDADGLRRFVRKRSAQLRDCYQRALKRDDAVGGKATFRFTIGTCGELSGVEIAGRRGKVDEAAACVARAMRAWRTPFRPAEPVTVEYPIAFSSSM